MGEEIKLSAEKRKDFSGKRLNDIRRDGKIPAILYGPDVENTPVIVDDSELRQAISTEHGENALIKLKVGGKKPVTTIIREIQVHPLSMNILHIDFGQIRMTEKVEVEIPVEVEGDPPGVKKEGGVLEHIIREIRVSCLPGDIPDNFVLDVSELNVGDHLKVSDIPKSDGVEILEDSESLVVNLVPPTEIKEEEEPAEEEEPEIIGREGEEEEPEPGEEKKEKPEPDKEEEDKEAPGE